ncbi:VHS domain-containing protein [Klebsormidium nitens]|uniref:VHS domain-containing protein n=1 Tax=Klebsormidium nitens TaxID=105231 RepID=A0A1Y1IXK0_KLENI|nr:VHS domain-containing protein [Klebsormidium nitens]|eukprot:GAQ93018.1 VHS domain-containing protein [Klebsormidium nitens]
MVISATEDNDEVTPVYRLDEICDVCRSSPPDVVKDIVDHVMRRLDHRSPYVKQKALRLIKFASGRAGPDFKRDIQRHSGTIRGLFHYKGQPDPLKGDAPNKAVRDMAHETVQAMFSTEAPPSGGPAAYSHKKMEGFGSTGSRDPGADSGRGAGFTGMISAGMKELETAVMAKGGLKDMVNSAVGQYTGRGSRKSFLSDENDRGSFRPPRENEGSYGGGGGESWRGGGGRGYSGGSSGFGGEYGRSNGDYSRSNGSFGRGGSADVWTNERADDDGAGDDVSNAREIETTSSAAAGSEEERLVEGITAPGGVRPAPTREALQSFMNSAATLDGRAIAGSLEGKLRSQRWQVRFRALCVIEALQRHEGGGGVAAVTEHFQAQPGAVTKNLDSPQASVREKAKKILVNFGLDNSAAPAAPAASSPVAKPAPVADLLNVNEPDLLGASSSTPAEPPKPQDPAPSADLLGDDLWSAPQTSAPPPERQASGSDLFSGLTVGSSEAAQKPGGGDSSELFAGMNLESGGPAPAASVPPVSEDPFGLSAPAANGGKDSLSDLLGGLSVAPPQSATVPPSQGVKSPPRAAPQAKQPLPPMPMPGFESAQWQQPQGLQGMHPPQGVPATAFMPPQQMGFQQMTPQQMQQMQMAYLHQMQQRGMGMPGMMPFSGAQPGYSPGFQAGFGGLTPQPQPAHGMPQNGAHFGGGFGGGLQPSGGSLGGSTFSSLGAGGSGDLFQNAGIAHSQENKAETKAFDFIADQLKTAKPGKSMR